MQSGELIGCGIWFCIQRVSTLHTFDGPRCPKNKKYLKKMWWWHHHHIFLGIYYFWGSRVHQKNAVWVLVGCGIKFHIQRALLLRIWVKTQGDMLKIWTKKVVFFILPPKLITIILLFSLGAHFRPQISSNADPKDKLYKFCGSPRHDFGLNALVP